MASHPASPKHTALFIAHPGHELRVHHWLELNQPWVCVLTDGSGRNEKSRLDSTTRILRNTGARPGPVYGRFTDRQIYNLLLQQDTGALCSLVDAFADFLLEHKIQTVAGDAVEGYNPSHDLCRYLISCAVRLAERRGLAPLSANYEFPLTGRPDQGRPGKSSEPLCIQLDAEAFARKHEAAQNYAELAAELEAALKQYGLEAFQTEHLHESAPGFEPPWAKGEVPYYERYGDEKKRLGHYQDVIRFGDHVLPIIDALSRHAETSPL